MTAAAFPELSTLTTLAMLRERHPVPRSPDSARGESVCDLEAALNLPQSEVSYQFCATLLVVGSSTFTTVSSRAAVHLGGSC